MSSNTASKLSRRPGIGALTTILDGPDLCASHSGWSCEELSLLFVVDFIGSRWFIRGWHITLVLESSC